MHICGARYGGHDHSSHHRLQLAAGTSTLPELGELAVVAGTSSEVSSEYTVTEVEEICLGDAAADTSSGEGAARPQHSDRCHDSENNNCNNQPMLSAQNTILYYTKDCCTKDFNPELFKKYM